MASSLGDSLFCGVDSVELPSWTSDSRCSCDGKSLRIRVGLAHNQCALFEPSDVSLSRGTITGLVGTNGAGKTSLTRTIASKKLPGFPESLRVTYISNSFCELGSDMNILNGEVDPEVGSQQSVHALTPQEYLQVSVEARVSALRKEVERLEELLEICVDDIENISISLAERYDEIDGLQASAKEKISLALNELGFAPHLDKSVAQLSCGWRYKCELIAAFVLPSDLLCIDEPSFLDVASTEWLVHHLMNITRSGNTMVLLISHKEALLQRLCDCIWYINSGNHTLSSYSCDYDSFRSVLESEVAHAERSCGEYEEKVSSATQSLKKIQSQLQRREKNRAKVTSEHSDQRFIKGKNKESKQKADRALASKVHQLEAKAAEMNEIRRMAIRERVDSIRIPGSVLLSDPLRIENVSVSYALENGAVETILSNVSAKLSPSEHVLLRGTNGSGKTTLLRVIREELEPSEGIVIRRGRIVYFPQTALADMTRKSGHLTALAYVQENLTITESHARQHLGSFGLRGNMTLRRIASLSSGQRVRLWLAKQTLIVHEPSILIVDEISENLDVETKKSLAELLNSFEGAVIAVSHDTDFCQEFRSTTTWDIHEGRLQVHFECSGEY